MNKGLILALMLPFRYNNAIMDNKFIVDKDDSVKKINSFLSDNKVKTNLVVKVLTKKINNALEYVNLTEQEIKDFNSVLSGDLFNCEAALLATLFSKGYSLFISQDPMQIKQFYHDHYYDKTLLTWDNFESQKNIPSRLFSLLSLVINEKNIKKFAELTNNTVLLNIIEEKAKKDLNESENVFFLIQDNEEYREEKAAEGQVAEKIALTADQVVEHVLKIFFDGVINGLSDGLIYREIEAFLYKL